MSSSLDIIKQILDTEMEMPPNRVWAYNQNNDLPQDSKLFIVLHFGKRDVIANNSKYINTNDGLKEVQSTNVREDIMISLLSKNNEARDRAHEVLMAMRSNYSQQLQEKNHIHISTTGDIYDASFLEGTSRINRFDVKIKLFKSYEKMKSVDYYNKFNFNLMVEDKGGNLQQDSFKIEEK
jgi:hypothetical protein